MSVTQHPPRALYNPAPAEITPERLAAVMPALTRARAEGWATFLWEACQRFGITTPRRVAALLAQIAHESRDLTRLQENLRYTTQARLRAVFGQRFVRAGRDPREFLDAPEQLANFVYAGRLGNGDEASGDGWRYRGRGPIQITGRKNYRMAGDAVGLPFEDIPDLLFDPEFGSLAACWFWHAAGANTPADTLDLVGVTQRINGPALAGFDDRRAYWTRAREVFGDQITIA